MLSLARPTDQSPVTSRHLVIRAPLAFSLPGLPGLPGQGFLQQDAGAYWPIVAVVKRRLGNHPPFPALHLCIHPHSLASPSLVYSRLNDFCILSFSFSPLIFPSLKCKRSGALPARRPANETAEPRKLKRAPASEKRSPARRSPPTNDPIPSARAPSITSLQNYSSTGRLLPPQNTISRDRLRPTPPLPFPSRGQVASTPTLNSSGDTSAQQRAGA